LQADRIGTDSVPPPIPIMVEKVPIRTPIACLAGPVGRLFRTVQPSGRKAMLAATMSAITAKTAVSTCPSTTSEMAEPTSTPVKTAGPQLFKSAISTLPRLKCARAELIEVKMMVASEVPTAICMRIASSTPMPVRMW
jgi:hypothetical protein